MKRKILYITGSRADYGLMLSTLNKIKSHPNLELEIIVTGMHLMEEFGKTINEIEKDNFKLIILDSIYERDNKESMATFIGDLIKKLVPTITKIRPDIILLLGDRGEMLAAAIAGAYLSIPVAHIHGGETTGNIDESARHAITKLSNIHFVATDTSAERIIKMGENPEYIFSVGAPGLDDIVNSDIINSEILKNKYKIDLSEPLILVIQHPVTSESNEAPNQIYETLNAIAELKYQAIVIYPNCDAGGRGIIEIIKKYKNNGNIKIYENIPRMDYLSLLKISSVIVGNSSSGIIEAPSFKIPVVNIGTRQEGRERAENVMDVRYDKKQIMSAIEKALFDKDFKAKLKNIKNPYGNGNSGDRIAHILSEIKIDNRLLQKKLTY